MTKTDWQPSAQIDTLKRRAQLLADVRRFFAERQVLEVDTPILSSAAPTAPYLDSFVTRYQPIAAQMGQDYYLQTSPEFAMKRLLAAGSGSIYQIARVFRNGELGRQHNPEFTMLEWYRCDFNLTQLIEETDQLLQAVAGLSPARIMRYQQVFQHYLQLDCFSCSESALRDNALGHIPGLPTDWQADRDGWLELLMSQVIEPQLKKLGCPVVIIDFPTSQAQLAKIGKNEAGRSVAARFELYAGGMELANGYDELLDADELARRFEVDNRKRYEQGKPVMPVDNHLLEAMRHGMPACSGVALGLDRLMMLMDASQSIQQVQSFSFERS